MCLDYYSKINASPVIVKLKISFTILLIVNISGNWFQYLFCQE